MHTIDIQLLFLSPLLQGFLLTVISALIHFDTIHKNSAHCDNSFCTHFHGYNFQIDFNVMNFGKDSQSIYTLIENHFSRYAAAAKNWLKSSSSLLYLRTSFYYFRNIFKRFEKPLFIILAVCLSFGYYYHCIAKAILTPSSGLLILFGET